MKKLKLLSILMLVAIVASACGGKAATQAPGATEGPAATQVPGATEAPAANLPEVAREDTVILGWSISSPIGVTNPWAVPGYTHQEGNVFLWEALAYYGIFASKEIPWLADSMEYNADFTQLTRQLLAPGGVWAAMKAHLSDEERNGLPTDVSMFHVEQLRVPHLDAARCLVWLKPANNSSEPIVKPRQ